MKKKNTRHNLLGRGVWEEVTSSDQKMSRSLSSWRVGGRAFQEEEMRRKSLRWKKRGLFPNMVQCGWIIVMRYMGMG